MKRGYLRSAFPRNVKIKHENRSKEVFAIF